MSDNDNSKPPDDGFEYNGTFYHWHVSDIGKDLMLIDRFSGMPLGEFFDVVGDNFDRGRGPILLTLIGTSIRFAHPEWSVERIVRMVMDMPLSDVHFVTADAEADTLPPASGEQADPTGTASVSPLKSPSSDQAQATSETSHATHG